MARPVAPEIARFLDALPDKTFNTLISHLDRSIKSLKLISFIIPCLGHFFLFSILLWRLWSHSDTILLFFPAPMRENESSSFSDLSSMMIKTSADLILMRLLYSVLYEFYCTHLYLRLTYGFRDTEVVFRKAKIRGTVSDLVAGNFRAYVHSILTSMRPNLLVNPGYLIETDC